MSNVAEDLMEGAPEIGRARDALVRRLIDVLALPSSNVPPQDRSMGSDILLELLFGASQEDLALCARRLADKSEAPRRLLRFLASAPIDIARHVLEGNDGIEDSDLAHVAGVGTPEHRLLIAQRKQVSAMLSDVLIDYREPHVITPLLKNRGASLSDMGLDAVLEISREEPDLCRLLLDRPELTPAHAMVLFWWADPDVRRVILTRHAAERMELIAVCSDVFPMMAAEGWRDPHARKAMQLIERRQRNRDAIEKSQFVNLEHAVETAAKEGMNARLAQEVGFLAGVKPITIAKLLSDKGGEGIAVLCKATGLKTAYLKLLWKSLRRPVEGEAGEPDPWFRRVLHCYQILSVAKAQTVLRYWNWSLSSAYSPTSGMVDEEDGPQEGNYSAARKTAALLFGGR
ncbi:MAG: DUF2336 domain-containing protein [Hyphomonadaceae bacterium]|nr:DUF2336 domain-containing protein [Hyphomonadaceae bacterium]